MRIEKAGEHVGAVVTDVDAARMTDAEWSALYQAWLDHAVLILRGQELSIPEFLAYGRRFGRVKPHMVRRARHAEYPELTVMGAGARKADGTVDKAIRNRGQGWHTDGPWDHEPIKATQLYGIEIPSRGGDTLFANMYMAYDALPSDLKARIEGVDAHYVYGGADRKGQALLEEADRNNPPTRYPLVRTHPESGRKSLYFNPHHILCIADVAPAESDALISELTEHMLAPGAEYRHQWRAGDVVTWDNRCTLHAATGDHPVEESRIHWRCTIMAD